LGETRIQRPLWLPEHKVLESALQHRVNLGPHLGCFKLPGRGSCCGYVSDVHTSQWSLHAVGACRFTEVFTLDERKTPRMWSGRDHIPSIARDARLAAAHVLSQLAVMRGPQVSPARLLCCLCTKAGYSNTQTEMNAASALSCLQLRFVSVQWQDLLVLVRLVCQLDHRARPCQAVRRTWWRRR
jgi:hypothetical protein